VVLLERAGGQVAFTRADYQAIVDRHGGSSLMAVHAEALGSPGADPDEVRVSLVTKVAGQGDLVS
jgi:hypothetical protein